VRPDEPGAAGNKRCRHGSNVADRERHGRTSPRGAGSCSRLVRSDAVSSPR
jgi:hypothetical protein